MKNENPAQIKSFSVIVLLFGMCSTSSAQMVISPNVPLETTVNDVLLGSGVMATNITFSGDPNQIGTFDGSNTNLGFDTGIVLGTGDVALDDGGNHSDFATLGGGDVTTLDADLNVLSNNTGSNDAAILEFDFVASGENLEFNYIFASEEYPEFVCSNFNDSFGFFLSGPDINGSFQNDAINLAVLPNSNPPAPVNINTVNSLLPPCPLLPENWPSFSEYFISNPPSNTETQIEYDGFTVKLTARATLTCGASYHIKIAIADATDSTRDSAVYLEANSFRSSKPDMSFANLIVQGDVIFESCEAGEILIERCNSDAPTEYWVTMTGDAIDQGSVDSPAIAPFGISLAAGESVGIVPLSILLDALEEVDQVLHIAVLETDDQFNALNLWTYTYTIRDYPSPNLILEHDNTGCAGQTVVSYGGDFNTELFEITWPDGSHGTTFALDVTETTEVWATITGQCENGAIAATTITLLREAPIVLSLAEKIELNCLQPLVLGPDTLMGGTGGIVSVVWTDQDGNTIGQAREVNFTPSETTYKITATDACGNQRSAEVEIVVSPMPLIATLPESISTSCEKAVLMAPTGEIPSNSTFEWTLDGIVVSTARTLEAAPLETALYELEIEGPCGETIHLQTIVVVKSREIFATVEATEKLCKGNVANLEVKFLQKFDNLSYAWSHNLPDAAAQVVSPAESTTYAVTISDACMNETTIEIPVEVVDFDGKFSVVYPENQGNEVILLDESNGTPASVTWILADGQEKHGLNPRITLEELNETVEITMIAEDENGCKSVHKEEYVPAMKVFIPNTFTPNGDGINDELEIKGHLVEKFNIEIVDRRGMLVYASQDINETWDGSRLENATQFERSEYSYKITAEGTRGQILEMAGSIMALK